MKVQRGVVEIIGTKTEFSKDTVRAREIELTRDLTEHDAGHRLDLDVAQERAQLLQLLQPLHLAFGYQVHADRSNDGRVRAGGESLDALADLLGSAGSRNIQDEEQKKLDVMTNDMLTEALLASPAVAGVACATSGLVAGHVALGEMPQWTASLQGAIDYHDDDIATPQGGTPLMELYLMHHAARKVFEGRGVKIARSLTGSYVTSLEMAGCSITVSAVDDDTLALWDAPVHTAALRWGM